MRALLLAALLLPLAGCAEPTDAADVAPAAAAAEAEDIPPAEAGGEMLASAGGAFGSTGWGAMQGRFTVPAAASRALATGTWSATAATGIDMRVVSPSGTAASAGSVGGSTGGAIELDLPDPEPGEWAVYWRANGAAADVTWRVDVTFQR